MFEAFLIVLSAGIFVAHALDAYRSRHKESLPLSPQHRPADGFKFATAWP